MVEFGLKLSDNQVSKWKLHYIDYELLKKLLKKVKKAGEAREEARARVGRDGSRDGSGGGGRVGSFLIRLGSGERVSLQGSKKDAKKVDLVGAVEAAAASVPAAQTAQTSTPSPSLPTSPPADQSPSPSDTTPLLLPSPTKSPTLYATVTTSLTSAFRSSPTSPPPSHLALTAAEAAFTKKHNEFTTALRREVQKVERFYVRKITEYSLRMAILVEAADMGRLGEGGSGEGERRER